MLQVAFGDHTIGRTWSSNGLQVWKWCIICWRCWRSVHPSASETDENVAEVKELVPEVWRTVIREVADLLGILFWSVWRISKDKLNIS